MELVVKTGLVSIGNWGGALTFEVKEERRMRRRRRSSIETHVPCQFSHSYTEQPPTSYPHHPTAVPSHRCEKKITAAASSQPHSVPIPHINKYQQQGEEEVAKRTEDI